MMSGGPTGRLFIAIPLPGKMVKALSEFSHACERRIPGRYVSPVNYHVTLAFLGETPITAVESDLETILCKSAEAFSQFSTDFTKPGYFGKESNATLWSGLQDSNRIKEIAGHVRTELDAAGLSYDRKPVRPHITIARKVDLTEQTLPTLPSCEGIMDSIVLFESTRKKVNLHISL